VRAVFLASVLDVVRALPQNKTDAATAMQDKDAAMTALQATTASAQQQKAEA
jgi:hypothetical protein